MASPKNEKLQWLTDQTAKFLFEGYGEPEAGFNDSKIHSTFREIATNWIDEARHRLDIERSGKFPLYYHDIFGAVISKFTTNAGHWFTLEFSLYDGYYRFEPVKLQIRLSVKGSGREYFDMVMQDYPRLLQDFLENNRAALNFSCHVGLDNEPNSKAKATEWLKVYLDNYDPEDEFFLEYDLKYNTSLQTIGYVMNSLVAIYDAATAYFEGEPDKLIQHHLKTFKGRKTKKTEKIKFIIESEWGFGDNREYYFCQAQDDKQAALKFKRRYRSFMDAREYKILRIISQKSDAELFEKHLADCYNYSPAE